MIRGTTAQFKFSLPYDYDDLQLVKVVFWQPGNSGTASAPLPILKTLNDCIKLSDRELLVTLGQLETLRFSEKTKARVQLTATTDEGERFASKQILVTVYPIYDDSPTGDLPTPSPTDDGWIILDGDVVTASE